ncbi:MAG: hypothetical protein JJ896_06875 [Rhodothermales bacterium]|nr:hypothetical protein [Rhodothermales bacterium]MBO6779360.1 hypothetical protein [Rhodothermales bacterium]
MRKIAIALLLAAVAFPVNAQEFSLGSDFVSRYVWRGADFGESLSMQPGLSFTYKGLEVGSWASYSVAPEGAAANEHDLWISYTLSSENSGSFSIGVTDYYFPAPGGVGFFDFAGDGQGAHWIEPFVSYSGPSSFPVELYGAMFAHNDPDNSVYVQVSYPFETEGVDLGLAVGAVTGESGFYGTDGFALVNVGLTASKDVSLTDRFSIPVSVSYILNPETERTFLVFGISL